MNYLRRIVVKHTHGYYLKKSLRYTSIYKDMLNRWLFKKNSNYQDTHTHNVPKPKIIATVLNWAKEWALEAICCFRNAYVILNNTIVLILHFTNTFNFVISLISFS
jgi:hypothetical protein